MRVYLSKTGCLPLLNLVCFLCVSPPNQIKFVTLMFILLWCHNTSTTNINLESQYLLKHICLLDYELWTFVSGPSFIYYPWLKTYYIPARPRLLHNDCIIIRPWFTLIYQFVPIVPLIHYGIYSITLIADLVKTQ